MPRFKATIEFNRASNDISLAEHYLRDKLYLGANLHITNLERLSITHEEAIKLIASEMEDYKNYCDVSLTEIYDNIKSILERVI